MLNAHTLERINGHSNLLTRNSDLGYSAETTCDCGARAVRIWSGWFVSEASALEALREKVLFEHRLIAMDNANWACRNCGRVSGMSAHHKHLRSHGRDDRISNLESLCQECHSREHERKG